MLFKKCKQRLCSVASLLKAMSISGCFGEGESAWFYERPSSCSGFRALSAMSSYLALCFLNEKSPLHYFISARKFIFVIFDDLTPTETVIRNLFHIQFHTRFSFWPGILMLPCLLCCSQEKTILERKVQANENH